MFAVNWREFQNLKTYSRHTYWCVENLYVVIAKHLYDVKMLYFLKSESDLTMVRKIYILLILRYVIFLECQ